MGPAMPYIPPGDVHSPRARWHLIEVLLDDGPHAPSYALGTWDHQRRIAFRWNGNDEAPIGNPQSRGLPTWTMMDERLHEFIVRLLPPQKEDEVRVFLGLAMRRRTKLI